MIQKTLSKGNILAKGRLPVNTITLAMLVAATPGSMAKPGTGLPPLQPISAEATPGTPHETPTARSTAKQRRFAQPKQKDKALSALVTLTRQASSWDELDRYGVVNEEQIFPASADVPSLIADEVANTLRHFKYAIFKQHASNGRGNAEWKVLKNHGTSRFPVWAPAAEFPKEWIGETVPQGVPVLETLFVKNEEPSKGFPLTNLEAAMAARETIRYVPPQQIPNPLYKTPSRKPW